jgi:photosystem I reaction center subunit XII
MITDFQVYIALICALLASVLAIRLSVTLYQ